MATKKKPTKSKGIDPKLAKELTEEGWEPMGNSGGAESFNEGDVVTGTLVGVTDTTFTRDDGEPARVVTLDTEDGQVTYWAPTILQSRLETLNPGDEVRIECLGKIRTKNGRNAWGFTVHAKRHSEARKAPERKPTKKATKKRGR